MAGGVIRWLTDARLQRRLGAPKTEEELTALGDRGPGVLLASGYIAGGAIAGILIAFFSGAFGSAEAAVTEWSKAHNPFYAGPYADMLALIPFALICAYLLWRAAKYWPSRTPAV
jgi:hypothetical protein